MSRLNPHAFPRLALLSISVFAAISLFPAATAQTVRPKTITRLFWQDRDTDKLSWADLVATNKWNLKRGWVTGFPALDAEKQDLMPMRYANGVLMLGVRDHQDGAFQSGWIAMDPGVFEEPHGNHNHWKYSKRPVVKSKQLDTTQGNPAHLYVYDDAFYLAHDKKNGLTQALPQRLKVSGATNIAKFYSGGGGHISLAAVNNAVCYATWIDADGDHAGQVDVVDLRNPTDQPAQSFKLPTGAIHGATVNSGKVFFAPADGICWITADPGLTQTSETIRVHHIPLGKDPETGNPRRTSAFANQRNWVMCATGTGSSSAFCLINAASSDPQVVTVPISVADGLRLTAPQVVLSLGKRYAFLFQDRIDSDSDLKEQLTVVELDPNRDRDFSDAKVRLNMPVGASQVVRHHGHHSICFDAYGRFAVFTNPGDGSLTILSLKDFTVQASFRVGGAPDGIIAIGAAEHFH